MNKTRTLIFGSAIAAAMLFGGVIGATVLAKSSNPLANTVLVAASPAAPQSNEATTHETGETAAQETAENNGTAPHGGPGGGPSNETATHEATEPTAREAAETS
jgi:uncharacterized membrane protein